MSKIDRLIAQATRAMAQNVITLQTASPDSGLARSARCHADELRAGLSAAYEMTSQGRVADAESLLRELLEANRDQPGAAATTETAS